MEFCNECGSKTEPDWVFCRSCGSPLDSPEIEAVAARPLASGNAPKVELISRGWDVVDIDATEADAGPRLPADPLDTAEFAIPLDPEAVEISVDEVTVVTRPQEAAPAAEDYDQPAPVPPSDRWNHLRPHGPVPEVSDPSRLPARISQIAVLVTALSALVSAVLFLYLNIQLERFAAGDISEAAVNDVRTVAEASLLVLAGLALVGLLGFGWWVIRARPRNKIRPGPAGSIGLPAGLGGGAMVGYFALLEKSTVADALTANSLIVIGLGLVMLASLATIRIISRVEIRDRW